MLEKGMKAPEFTLSDKNGNEVIAPTYKLENNTVIDFIGKWHIAEDINANYYTDMN